jgi:hypothetical protein
MRDYKKAVQDTKCERRNGKEIHRCDGFTVIVKKYLPAPSCFRILGAFRVQRETVRSEILNPSFSNSPWMRGAPQVGFSATMRKIRSATFD